VKSITAGSEKAIEKRFQQLFVHTLHTHCCVHGVVCVCDACAPVCYVCHVLISHACVAHMRHHVVGGQNSSPPSRGPGLGWGGAVPLIRCAPHVPVLCALFRQCVLCVAPRLYCLLPLFPPLALPFDSGGAQHAQHSTAHTEG